MKDTSAQPVKTDSSPLDEAFVALARDPLTNGQSLQQSLEHIAKTCASRLDASRASIWQLQSNTLVCLCAYQLESDDYDASYSLRASDFPNYFNVLNQKRVIDVVHARTDPRTIELAESYFLPLDIMSTLDATLRYKGVLQGVICLEQQGNYRAWSREEQIFLASVAELVGQRFILEQMRASEARYRALFDGIGDCIFVLTDGVFSDCNKIAERVFRCTRDQLIGHSPATVSPERQPDGSLSTEAAKARIDSTLDGNTEVFDWRHTRFDGEEFDSEVCLNTIQLGGLTSLIGIVRDITHRRQDEEELRLSRQQLEYRALHDSLTGLPNRDKLHEDAPILISDAAKKGSKVALILLDLNRFKEVNDTFGHSTGDQLLKQLSRHLKAFLKTQRVQIYRLGGDEFVALVDEINRPEEAIDVASELSGCLRTPMQVQNIHLELGASIGIALYPDHGASSHELLRSADVAMYHAKSMAIPLSMYDQGYDLNTPRRLALMSELGRAIRENELCLYYQPLINLKTGECTSCEALLRWQHPKLGLIMPDDFIAAAEMSDNIHLLSEWVVRNAMKQAQRWLAAGREIPVSINLSARNLMDQHFPLKFASILEEQGLPAHLIEIEITESSLISDPLRARKVLKEIDKLGVLIAIDDFGTGYSSLRYLRQLPLDTLKIDRTFVQDMLTDYSNAMIVRSTIDLAHNFGLEVVAEGVEDQETLNVLEQLNCDSVQGYFFSKPVPIAKLESWLEDYAKNPHVPGFDF